MASKNHAIPVHIPIHNYRVRRCQSFHQLLRLNNDWMDSRSVHLFHVGAHLSHTSSVLFKLNNLFLSAACLFSGYLRTCPLAPFDGSWGMILRSPSGVLFHLYLRVHLPIARTNDNLQSLATGSLPPFLSRLLALLKLILHTGALLHLRWQSTGFLAFCLCLVEFFCRRLTSLGLSPLTNNLYILGLYENNSVNLMPYSFSYNFASYILKGLC